MKKISLFILFFGVFFALNAQRYLYKEKDLDFEIRANDLLSSLTLEEKITLMLDESQPIERLGVKRYAWWNEALHGVARAGLATVFPQPVGMAASFDDEGVLRVFSAVSDEARAKNTAFAKNGERGRYQCLTFWTPTINIFRDPRWGRGMESYGEDPYLTAVMGVNVVNGLQGANTDKYDKLHACAKHFAVHSGPEWNRHSFDVSHISSRDLYETYLPAFEALVKDANVQEVMCAYNAFDGKPCCGSDSLLNSILRDKWGFQGIVVSDCGAIDDFYRKNAHATHQNAAFASAAAVLSGTDLNCGNTYTSLVEAVQNGRISENDINVSVKRLLLARYRLGEMDDLEDVLWTKIPYSVVASDAHAALSLEMAKKSMTLLMNKNSILPLSKNLKHIAVIGANANDSVMQWGNYNGMPRHTVTILEGIKKAVGKNTKITYLRGCELAENKLQQSIFDQCKANGKTGFEAKYWNNTRKNGNPDVVTQVSSPFRFSAAGATVFARGVNLTDFSADYTTVLTPQNSGEAVLDFMFYGTLKLFINGELIRQVNGVHGNRVYSYTLAVEKGKTYDIKIDYTFARADATLNFDIYFKGAVDYQKILEQIKDADAVIFAGGISPSLEGEEMGVNFPGFKGGDRTEIELPDVQRNFLKALNASGKKVIFVNCSGSPIALEPETETCDAILQAWYSGQEGGTAVAAVLFGDYNPAGRLPVTFYRNLAQVPDFEDYNMANRTYRYMKEKPLFPFGYGLSYSDFQYGEPTIVKNEFQIGETVKVEIPVTNTSKRDGDEVVQVYLRNINDPAEMNKTLRAFKRINIPAGKTVNVAFELTEKQLVWWNETAQEMTMLSGDFEILVGKSSDDADLQRIGIAIK